MAYKNNYDEFKKLIEQHHITTLYHFTDRENLESIIKNGGLYSWADCEQKGISISKPGGSMGSRDLDRRDNLQNFVRVSFVREHPMMYVAMNEGRISNPVVLEIDPEVIYWQDSLYADRNATKNGALVGSSIDDFSQLHFNSFKAKSISTSTQMNRNSIRLKCLSKIIFLCNSSRISVTSALPFLPNLHRCRQRPHIPRRLPEIHRQLLSS